MTYLPKNDPELLSWLSNFITKLSTHQKTLNVSDAEFNALKAEMTMLTYLIRDAIPAYRAKAQEFTAYKDLMKEGPVGAPAGSLPAAITLGTTPTTVTPGVLPRVQTLVQRLKKTLGYSESIGQDLGIIAPRRRGE